MQQPKVSLCMIVKNEEANLPACLESVKGLFDEIIIVDTGSTDKTKEIALQYGALVSDFEWCDDFSAARNQSLALATGKWIFWLDADHRVDQENYDRLNILFEGLQDEKTAFMMLERAYLPSTDFPIYNARCRLFRSHPQLVWRCRVHETPSQSIKDLGYQLRTTDIIIQHIGYEDPLVYQKKIKRNLQILEKEKDEILQKKDPILLAHVYYELSRHYREFKKPTEALSLLKYALNNASMNSVHYADLFFELIRVYRDLHQWDNALNACKQAQTILPRSGQLLFEESQLLETLGHPDKAIERLLELVSPHRTSDLFDDPSLFDKAHYNLAIYFRKQNKPKEVETHLLAVVAHNPKISLAWQELIQLYTSQMRWTEALNICQKAKAQTPDDISAYFWESWIQIQLKNDSQAQTLLLQLIEKYPSLNKNNSGIDLAMIHHNLGIAYHHQEDDQKAEKHWIIALKENPRLVPSWFALTILWIQHEKWESLSHAIADLETIIHYDEMAVVIKAKLLAAQRKLSEAISLLKEYIPTHPEMIWPKIILGEIALNASQELPYAEKVLQDVLTKEPNNNLAKQLLNKIHHPR